VEKKLSPKGGLDSVRLYEPVRFEEGRDKAASGKGLKKGEGSGELEKEGYEKGYAEGYDKGVKDGEKETAAKLKRLEGIIKEIEGYKEKKVNELLPQFIDLSMEIAKKIVHKEIELDKDVITHIARDAVKRIEESVEEVIIKVSPADYEVMRAYLNELKEQSGLKNIVIEPQQAISPGGCYIEMRTGEIDARIEEQIKEIGDAVGTATNSEV